MREFIRSNTLLRRLYYRLKMLRGIQGQSDEGRILSDLAEGIGAPKSFVEFGFHPIQFNCARLAQNQEWRGLLIDGSARQVADGKVLFPERIEIVEMFLTLDNLEFVASKFLKLGVLSIDVDGNDYWFLERLIGIGPSIISVEYNASMALRPLTVPYDPNFDRHEKHPSGWYHGASLTAFAKLCAAHGYGLAAVSDAGANAFFTRYGALDPVKAWRPNVIRRKLSGTTEIDQWNAIKDLPYISV